MMVETPPHLGGHLNITNMDVAALDYFIERYGILSLLDVGCGPGGMVDVAKQRGIAAWGIDGDPKMARCRVYTHDYTTGPVPVPIESFDLIWCMEFVEHVEAEFIPNFLDTFRAGRVLFLTHALPGQGGHHHVNEQMAEYWIDILDRDGWNLDTEATQWLRENGDAPFTRWTGMAFTRGQ